MKHLPHLTFLALVSTLASCGSFSKKAGPTIITPSNGKVDLSKVSMKITKAKITSKNENEFALTFDYTLINADTGDISFTSIFASKDDLIDIQLSDQQKNPLILGKRPFDGMTLAAPRPMIVPFGKSTRSYTIPIMPELRMKNDPITVRVRFHAPSRYDELRSTVEAPLITATWPESLQTDLPLGIDSWDDPTTGDNPLTYPASDATYPSR